MSTIVTRAGKGSALTNTEVDSNFTNLNTDKIQVTGAPVNGYTILWNSATSTWVPGVSGSGDVSGPASSTDNAFTRFDSTTGKLIQNSTGATLSDTGAAVFTGALDVLGNSTAGSNLKLYEDTDNGTNYVSFKAPDTIAANVTWTLPSADGTNTQVLQTNGSGVLSFVTVAAGGGPILQNTNTITSNQIVASGSNGLSVGPITINTGVSVTVASGQTYVVI